MLESLFNEVAGLKSCNFIKKRFQTQVFSCEIRKIFSKTFFYRTPPVAASVFFFRCHVWTADEYIIWKMWENMDQTRVFKEFFTFFKLCEWYQIAQRTTHKGRAKSFPPTLKSATKPEIATCIVLDSIDINNNSHCINYRNFI